MAHMKNPVRAMTVEEVMRYYGVDRIEAALILAMERGEIDGDDVRLNADGKVIRRREPFSSDPRTSPKS